MERDKHCRVRIEYPRAPYIVIPSKLSVDMQGPQGVQVLGCLFRVPSSTFRILHDTLCFLFPRTSQWAVTDMGMSFLRRHSTSERSMENYYLITRDIPR